MSRDFKLKLGFTSPKQPSPDLKDSQVWPGHQRHTFLSVTQRAKHTTQTSRTADLEVAQWAENSHNSSHQLTSRRATPSVKSSQDSNNQSGRKGELTEIKSPGFVVQFQMTAPKREQQSRDQRRGNCCKLVSTLTTALRKHQLRVRRTGFKCISSYVRNLESLHMIALFKQHCAVVIQKHFRRYIATKHYRCFRKFLVDVRPRINALQEGWKLRRVLATKPVFKLLRDFKQKQAQGKDQEARIIKRQVSSMISRLYKGTKWLACKGDLPRTKSIQVGKPHKTEAYQRTTGTTKGQQSQQAISLTAGWQDIPIKPSKGSILQDYLEEPFVEPPFLPKPKPKPKTQKVYRKPQTKDPNQTGSKTQQQPLIGGAQCGMELPKDPGHLVTVSGSRLEQQYSSTRQQSSQNINKQPKTKSKSKSKSKSKPPNEKQLLLEKRTKYDPRKAAQQQKSTRQLKSDQQTTSQSVEPSQPQSRVLALESIRQLPPKQEPQSRRNIMPKETNSVLCPTTPVGHSSIPKQHSRHVSINQLLCTFGNTYASKMSVVVQKISRLKQESLKSIIPCMRSDSQFLRKCNPKYFDALQTHIIQTHQFT